MRVGFLFIIFIVCACRNKQNFAKKFRDLDSSLGSKKTVEKESTQKHLFDSTITLLNKLKSELTTKDSTGEKIGLSDSLIVYSSEGTNLYNDLLRTYKIGISKSKDEKMKSDFTKMILEDRQNWLYKFFHNIPTIAAVTILTKFENDVVTIERL